MVRLTDHAAESLAVREIGHRAVADLLSDFDDLPWPGQARSRGMGMGTGTVMSRMPVPSPIALEDAVKNNKNY